MTILVLSRESLESKWVGLEVEAAEKKERELGRPVLCPISIDNTWENPPSRLGIGKADLAHMKRTYNIVDFRGWEDKRAFGMAFKRLWDGLEANYRIRGER